MAGRGEDEIVLEIEVPDDATDWEVLEGVRELVDAADRLHSAHGGHGLKVNTDVVPVASVGADR